MTRMSLAAALAFACGTALAQGKAADLERGKYLVEGVMACGHCHAARVNGERKPALGLAGGIALPEPTYRAFAPNITPDPETGIGKWSDAELGRAIREGIRPDGSVIGPPMPFDSYRAISDDDLRAIVVYLRAQPAVRNDVPKSVYPEQLKPYGPPLAKVSGPDPRDRIATGKYLVELAHCMGCHTPRDEKGMALKQFTGAGGQLLKRPYGDSLSRNLTPHESGLRDWTQAQFAAALRENVSPQGIKYKPVMPTAAYGTIADADIAAMLAYLRSLPPLPFGGR
ncbi:c-type cytochrome [Ramlibacter albus]|uniref:C-type cytochrome n=1 Tax=Ramlibacter albus TaxID=2079448 RepID=A0A923MFC6_9BURK|nr:c-type cytochrome [Ramlibacter albus]MBC5768566.1 c-type cytochrome [Ramlibacter albus]